MAINLPGLRYVSILLSPHSMDRGQQQQQQDEEELLLVHSTRSECKKRNKHGIYLLQSPYSVVDLESSLATTGW